MCYITSYVRIVNYLCMHIRTYYTLHVASHVFFLHSHAILLKHTGSTVNDESLAWLKFGNNA